MSSVDEQISKEIIGCPITKPNSIQHCFLNFYSLTNCAESILLPNTHKGFDMKFFLSGEIDVSHPHDLISKKFQIASDFVTGKLTPVLEANNYGPEVLELNIIQIIMKLPPPMENTGWFKERKLFQRKRKSTDFRLRIDYNAFCNGDDKLRIRLIFDNIIQSVRVLESRTSKHFQGAKLEQDITDCFNQNIQSV